jgi:hypothetical protein
MRMKWLVVVVMGLSVVAWAKKGGNGGGGNGGGGSTLTGTVWYFSNSVESRSIGADGTNDQATTGGHPSHALHGGKRWMLHPNTDPSITLPDGRNAGGLRAISSAGDSVELIAPAAGRHAGGSGAFTLRWSKDDAYASFVLLDWWGTGALEAAAFVVRIEIDWSTGSPEVVGNEETVLEVPLNENLNWAESYLRVFDWAPPGEGDKLVYETRENGRSIRVYDVDADSDTLLSDGIQPAWSPDGSRIAFSDVHIYSISPSGSGKSRLVRNATSPIWSPDSAHIALVAGGLRSVGASGGKAKEIGSVNPAFLYGWR